MADEEKDITKEQYETIANIITAVGTETAGGSAKERAASLKKTLDNQAELLKVFRGGIPVDLGTADKKAIVSAAQTAGIDVTEKQEDSAEDTQRFLVNLAFKAKREDLKAAKLKAKEDENLTKQAGLHMKGLWMDASNKITNGILDLKENIAKNTDISNLSSAFSQEMSTLSMAFSGLMEAPGMKLIVASLKYIAGWIAKAAWPLVRSFWAAYRKDLIKRRVAKETGEWQGLMSRFLGRSGTEAKAQRFERRFTKKALIDPKTGKQKLDDEGKKMWDIQKRSWKERAGFFKKRQQTKVKGLFSEKDDKDKKAGEKPFPMFKPGGYGEIAKGWSQDKDLKWTYSRMKFFGDSFKDFGKRMNKFSKKILPKFFTEKDNEGLTKSTKVFKAASGLFRKAITAIAGAFTGFSLAMLGWVALFVLIVVAFFVINQLIQDNLEKIKVRFKQAVDKFKNTFKKAGNWFKDLGEDIWYSIKMLGARIKDGFASMANKVITKLNKIPGVDIEKWDTGNVEKLEGEHEDVLAGRIDRDQKLLGEYKALSVERGKQLEDAAKADADRKAEKDAGTVGGNQQVNTSIQTDAREVHMSSESTQPTDFIGMRANMALDG